MALFEVLYGRKCRAPLCCTELDEKRVVGSDLIREIEERDIEFQVGDMVFLKVSPWKKVLRFGSKGKLSSRKYRSDPSHVVPVEEIEVQDDLTYEQEPVEVLAREEKDLRNKRVS
ncbi:uncharacterized protein LOC128042502 [Gossypium raimondii]|uniref:uncharacterized protein LOC128042502 n=1 Tax=Gossypium raimondii TaxID=29730 RepID=UPI00227D0BFC|nr:uncharacterized protein LOC128042502 [Gossypium raimondii]